MDCTWIIRAPLNRQIRLNVTDFEMEVHPVCRMDFLEIRYGVKLFFKRNENVLPKNTWTGMEEVQRHH